MTNRFTKTSFFVQGGIMRPPSDGGLIGNIEGQIYYWRTAFVNIEIQFPLLTTISFLL